MGRSVIEKPQTEMPYLSVERTELPEGCRRAELILAVLTILWGSSFAAIKIVLGEMHYSLLLAYRFTIAAAVLLPFYIIRRSGPTRAEWKAGIVLSVFLFGGYLTQTIGLQSTTASKSAFITSMVVVFVPLVSILMERKFPRSSSLVGVVIATAGLCVLTQPEVNGVNPGDLWTLACSFIWAIYIVQLQIDSRKHDRFSLLFVQMVMMTLGCWVAAAVESIGGEEVAVFTLPSLGTFGLLFYLGVACTALTTGLQTFFQRGTTSTRAALIYTVEPIAATIIAWLWISERMTSAQALGAAIVLGGILFTELFPNRR